MNFDPQIVAQANAFVNALHTGRRARVPALKLEYWQQFMTLVYAGLGLALCRALSDAAGIPLHFRLEAAVLRAEIGPIPAL